MLRILAAVQILIILSLIIYSTIQLFRGKFEQAIAVFPFLLLYYVFVVARQKRKQQWEDDDEDS